MTIPVSSVPAAKAFVFNALSSGPTALVPDASDNGMHELLVCYDQPGPYEPDDIVSVGAVSEREVRPSAMVGSEAQYALEEQYGIEVTVDCFRGGDQARVTYERAWALLSGIETAVRTDPTLGGAVLWAKPQLARDEPMWEDDHKGRRVRLTLSIDCLAIL